jgi:hypothetical protein
MDTAQRIDDMDFRRTILTACLALAVMATASPASAAGDDQKPPPSADKPPYKTLESPPKRFPQGGLDCIFFRSIYDWRAIDHYNLIIWAPNRRSPYHVELDRPCDGLRFTDTIAFSSNLDGRLCAFGGDAVVVDHDRCPIGAITKLNREQLDYLLSQIPGKKKKDDDKKKKK